jgi:hypothetical protein
METEIMTGLQYYLGSLKGCRLGASDVTKSLVRRKVVRFFLDASERTLEPASRSNHFAPRQPTTCHPFQFHSKEA